MLDFLFIFLLHCKIVYWIFILTFILNISDNWMWKKSIIEGEMILDLKLSQVWNKIFFIRAFVFISMISEFFLSIDFLFIFLLHCKIVYWIFILTFILNISDNWMWKKSIIEGEMILDLKLSRKCEIKFFSYELSFLFPWFFLSICSTCHSFSLCGRWLSYI